jgi:hypothetical protein
MSDIVQHKKFGVWMNHIQLCSVRPMGNEAVLYRAELPTTIALPDWIQWNGSLFQKRDFTHDGEGGFNNGFTTYVQIFCYQLL